MNIEKIREAIQQARHAREMSDAWQRWCEGAGKPTDENIPHPSSPFFFFPSLPKYVQEDIRALEVFLQSEEARASGELLLAAGKFVHLCDPSGGCPVVFSHKGLWESGWDRAANPIDVTAVFRRNHNVSIVEFIRRFVDMVADSLLPLPVIAR